MLRILSVLVVLLCSAQSLLAQTETPIPTPTPDVSQMWTVEASVNALGTPFPPMEVVFRYDTNAGEIAIVVFLAAILLLMWTAFLLYLLIVRGQK